MILQAWNVWKLQAAAMALQGTLQKVLLHLFHANRTTTLAPRNQTPRVECPMAADLPNSHVSIDEEACGEGVPVGLVLDAGGAQVLADDVEVQPAHGWHLQGNRHIMEW